MNIQPINNNSSNNNVKFQAKMTFDFMKDNVRWKKLAKEFEKRTKDCPDDNFNIIYNYYNQTFNFGRIKKDGEIHGQNDYSTIKNPLKNMLEKLDDNELIKKLVILYYLQREKDTVCEKAQEFCTNYVEIDGVSENLKTRFYNVWFALEDAVQRKHLKKDKLLYNNRKYLELY